ncbi:DUF6597 domain-containing transcriptional factor [Haloechinothrix salitolerans]|uniref:DUF6597 domain-containing transcriptional factor n=1 Tax=Haloechinothrix salitolerans TaxID=926830 RepID=A0ABW2BRP7_9PSEU
MFTSLVPRAPTATSVKSIWLFEGDCVGETTAPREELRLPTGAVEILFNLREDFFRLPGKEPALRTCPSAVVAGPYQRPYVLDTAQQSSVLGVVCHPGGARPLLGVSVHELRDRHVALDDLWGADADRLREQLVAAPDASTRLRTLESALSYRLTNSTRVAHPLAAVATAYLSGTPTQHGVGQLGERFGYTPRRIEQVFRADVGLSPKAYQRLQRFRSALRRIDDAAWLGWSTFASQHGYSDQAHLIREFRAHCGLTPTTYLRHRGERLNHVPLPPVSRFVSVQDPREV